MKNYNKKSEDTILKQIKATYTPYRPNIRKMIDILSEEYMADLLRHEGVNTPESELRFVGLFNKPADNLMWQAIFYNAETDNFSVYNFRDQYICKAGRPNWGYGSDAKYFEIESYEAFINKCYELMALEAIIKMGMEVALEKKKTVNEKVVSVNNNKEKKKMSKTFEMVRGSLVHGAKVAAADEAGTAVIGIAAEMFEGVPQISAALETETGKQIAKLVLSTTILQLIESKMISDEKGELTAALAMVIEATGRDFIQPQLARITPRLTALAAAGKNALTTPTVPAEK